jgi:pimeloyl-ACP methyl ester carboxylesterase
MLAELALGAALAATGPCTTATETCTEWVPLGGGPSRSLVYRSFPLEQRNEAVTRALVMIHGQGRDADGYFRTALAAAFLAGRLEDTIVVSPRFASSDGSCRDTLAADEVNWACARQSWRSGAFAVSHPKLASYDLLDELLRRLSRKDVFPSLRSIVVAGHSAGGQYVSRYAMASTAHEGLGVPVTYVVSNPSSYGYPDANRPKESLAEFGPFEEGRNCTTYDNWPYGLKDRVGYAAKLGDEQLRAQLVSRPVVYLLGELDTTPLAGFDASCPAMAQGPNRLERGRAFAKYVTERYGARHQVKTVPLCGHSARCMFTAEAGLPALFPKEP